MADNKKAVCGGFLVGDGLEFEGKTLYATSTGGTEDYTELENKPSINNVELNGNKTLEDLGVASKDDLDEAVTTLEDAIDNIVDDIESVDTTLQQHADKIAANSSRIDTFTHLPEGSTTGDAELADIRVGYNGETYSSAGSAVREQVSGLKQDLDKFVNYESGTNLVNHANNNGRYSRTSATGWKVGFIADDDYYCTDIIPLPNGTRYIDFGSHDSNGNYQAGYRYGFAFFDDNGNAENTWLSESFVSNIVDLTDYNNYQNITKVVAWWKKSNNYPPFLIAKSDEGNHVSYTPYGDVIKLHDVKTYNGVDINNLDDRVFALEHPDRPTESIRVNCWGDSLTYGSGSSEFAKTYPQQLLSILRANGNTRFETLYGVLNNGNAGGSVQDIATYQGALKVYIKPTTINASGITSVELTDCLNLDVKMMIRAGNYITDAYYDPIRTGYKSNGEKMNPCKIAGVSGNLFRTSTGDFTFNRLESGEPVTFDRPVVLETYGSTMNTDNVVTVIWAGTNNTNESDFRIVADTIQGMINNLGNNKYIIIGLTSKAYHNDVADKNNMLGIRFFNHFLDIRNYILSYGLSDAGITPTAQDLEDISNGEIPSSLRSDSVHGNDAFYRIVAEQVYKKGKEMGYWM